MNPSFGNSTTRVLRLAPKSNLFVQCGIIAVREAIAELVSRQGAQSVVRDLWQSVESVHWLALFLISAYLPL